MMDLKGYFEKTGVSKKKYVDNWIDKELIPGATRDADTNTYQFLDSSRRPYQSRGLKPEAKADNLRAHIVKAALMRRHISHKMCYMSKGEFDLMVAEMVDADLLQLRTEDGVVYIDSTSKSSAFANKGTKEIRKFVLECLATVTKATAEGVTKAVIDSTLTPSTAA